MESHSPLNNQPLRDFDGAVMTKELPLKDNITRSVLDHNHSFPGWTCQKCSSINELGVTNCEVCQTPRGACPRCGLVNPTTASNCMVCNALLGPPRGESSLDDFQPRRAVSELSSTSRTSSPIPDGSLGLQKGFLDRLYRRYMEHFRVDMCKDPRKCTKGPYMCFDAHAQSALRRKPECMADPVTGLPRWNYFPKLCRLMSDQVLCQNAKCRFAHSMQEIVYHPLLYKTKLCAHVLDSSGHCQGYGIHCSKAHSQEELRSPGPLDVLSPDLSKMDKFADKPDKEKLSDSRLLPDGFKYGMLDKFDRISLDPSSHREPRDPVRLDSRDRDSNLSRDFPFHVSDISHDVRHRERDHHHRRDSLRDSERDRRDRDRARERHHSQDFSLNQRVGNHTILSNAYSSVKDGPLPKPLREIYMYQYKTSSCEVQGCKLCNKFHNMKERRRSLGDYDYTALPCLKVFNPQTNTWKEPSRCPKGDTCPQAHTKVESMYHPENYKTQICGKAEESVCSWGVACAFAHGERDLSKYFRDPEELLPGHSYKQKTSPGPSSIVRRDRNSDSNPPRYEGDWPQQPHVVSRSPGTSPVQRTLHSGSPSSDYQPRNSNSSNPGSRSSESMSASDSNRDSFSANSDGSRGSVSVHSNDSRSSISLSHGPDHNRGAGSAPLPNGLISMMMSHSPDATLSDGSSNSSSLFNSFNTHKKEESKSGLQFPIPVDGYSFSSTSAPPSPYSVSSTGSRSKIVGPLAITDVYEKEHRRSEELVAVVRRLQSEVEDLMRKVQCPVCLDRERSVALVPCGHVLCEKCQNDIHVANSSNTKSCPLCNKEITQSLAVLL